MSIKSIAIALMVLAIIPLVASASGAMVVSGTVTDGRISSGTSLMSEQYADYMSQYGVSSHVMGQGNLAYSNMLVTSPVGVETAHSLTIDSGKVYGSASTSMLTTTKPQDVNLCPNCEGETCTPAMYTRAITGTNFGLTSGALQTHTLVTGPSITSQTIGTGAGSIGVYADWKDMVGGCPDVSVESGFSSFSVSGRVIDINAVYLHG